MKMLIKFLPSNYYVYVAVFIAHTGCMLISMSIGWSSTILDKLNHLDDNPLGRKISSTEKGLLGALPTTGGIIGSLVSAFIARTYGRKYSLIFEGIPSIIAYLLLAFATNIFHLYVARFLMGISVGGAYTVNIMYFAEVSQTSNRGLLGTAMTCFLNFGMLFVLILGALLSFKIFHLVCLLVPLIFTALVYFFVPESPYFLINKDMSEAKRCLEKLRGTSNVEKELNGIKEFVDDGNENASWGEILSDKALRKGLIIACSLISFQIFSGSIVISSYCQQIFDEVESSISSSLAPIILAAVVFIMGLVTPSLIDRSGRKILLLISHTGVCLTLFLVGMYFYLSDNGEDVTSISWLPLTALILYFMVFAIGVNSIPWTIVGELFPMKIKEVAAFACNVVNSVASFILLMNFHYMIDYLGLGITFWIFVGLGIIAIIFVKFYVIETKGKTFDQIQNDLGA